MTIFEFIMIYICAIGVLCHIVGILIHGVNIIFIVGVLFGTLSVTQVLGGTLLAIEKRRVKVATEYILVAGTRNNMFNPVRKFVNGDEIK